MHILLRVQPPLCTIYQEKSGIVKWDPDNVGDINRLIS